MDVVLLLISLVAAATAALWMLRGTLGRRRWRRLYDKAARTLRRDVKRLEREFLATSAAIGSPSSVLWNESRFCDTALLARDRASGDIYALVEVTLAFQAIDGRGVDDVAAVGDLRSATALLEWRDQCWTTSGRLLMNLQPREAFQRYSKNLEAIRRIHLSEAS